MLAETIATSLRQNYLFHISKCTANAKILFPVYFLKLSTSLTLAYFVFIRQVCAVLLIKEVETYSKTRDNLDKGC